jgi:hypothetical protein
MWYPDRWMSRRNGGDDRTADGQGTIAYRIPRSVSRRGGLRGILVRTALAIGRANPCKGNLALRRAPRRRKTATGMRQDSPRRAQTDAQNPASETGPALDMVEPGTTG